MDDFFDDYAGIDCKDWMIIGPLCEDIAREKRDIERARRERDDDQDLDYWEWLDRK
jgi:hypothetical protein